MEKDKDSIPLLFKLIKERTEKLLINSDTEYISIKTWFFDIVAQFKLRLDGLSPEFIGAIASAGLLPFSMGAGFVPKFHFERSLISLKNFSIQKIIDTNEVRTSKMYQTIKTRSLKKCIRKIYNGEKNNQNIRYKLAFNRDFDKTIDFARAKTTNFWISKQYQKSLSELAIHPYNYGTGSLKTITSELISIDSQTNKQTLLSVDIGYTLGKIYCSISGACDKNIQSLGILHLILIGMTLKERGFLLWDMGMDLKYKTGLGANLYNRSDLLKLINVLRNGSLEIGHLELDINELPCLATLKAEFDEVLKKRRDEIRNRQISKMVVGELKERTNGNPQLWTNPDLIAFLKIKTGFDFGNMQIDDFLTDSKEKKYKSSKRKFKKAKKILLKRFWKFPIQCLLNK